MLRQLVDAFPWPGVRPARRLLERASDEDGSTLLMYPFAVLIVLAIGAIAIDGAVLFQAHRQAVDVAAGLASDMAAVIDEEAFAGDGTVRVDPTRARDVLAYANDVVLADHPNGLVCTATVGLDTVAVTCSGTGEPLLLTISGRSRILSFRATSTERQDP